MGQDRTLAIDGRMGENAARGRMPIGDPIDSLPDVGIEETQAMLRRARMGNEGALDAYFERMRPRLEAWIATRLGGFIRSRLDVEDILQETLLQAFRGIPDLDLRGSQAAFAWLRRIAENRIRDACDHQRAAKRDAARNRDLHSRMMASWTSPSLAAVRREEHEQLLNCLRRLPEIQREIIRLIRIEGKSYAEAGERLGISAKNAGVRLVRAMKALKDLRRQGGGDSEW